MELVRLSLKEGTEWLARHSDRECVWTWKRLMQQTRLLVVFNGENDVERDSPQQ